MQYKKHEIKEGTDLETGLPTIEVWSLLGKFSKLKKIFHFSALVPKSKEDAKTSAFKYVDEATKDK
jgi:hypothetical protein